MSKKAKPVDAQLAVVPKVKLKKMPRSKIEQAVEDVTDVVNHAAEVVRKARAVYDAHIEPHVKRMRRKA